MEPQNIIMGDATGVELPQKEEDQTAIKELQKKAKYSRSKEYAALKEKAQARIEFYQRFLPSGMPVLGATPKELERKWELANIIIAEFDQLFSEHENADVLLKEAFGE